MCRFICYRGPDLLLADLLYRPANSLIRQSFHALDRPEPLNGDGLVLAGSGVRSLPHLV